MKLRFLKTNTGESRIWLALAYVFKLRFLPFLAAAVLFVAFLGNVIWQPERTFVVEALTSGGEITFAGDHNAWPISGAVFCIPKPRSRTRNAVASDGPCDARAYTIVEPEKSVLRWADDSRVSLRVGDDGSLKLRVLDDLTSVPKDTIIVFGNAYLQDIGALSFAGSITIGRPLNTGSKDILYEGRYRVRETHVLSSVMGKQTYEVLSSDLTRGEEVAVVHARDADALSLGYGHITLPLESTKAVQVVFHSSLGDHAIRASSLGLERPALIKPDWVDSTLASPYVLIVGLFVSLLISIFELHALIRQD